MVYCQSCINRPRRRGRLPRLPFYGERYANHILCHEDLRGILEAWDRAEKKIFHGGVVLYRIR